MQINIDHFFKNDEIIFSFFGEASKLTTHIISSFCKLKLKLNEKGETVQIQNKVYTVINELLDNVFYHSEKKSFLFNFTKKGMEFTISTSILLVKRLKINWQRNTNHFK